MTGLDIEQRTALTGHGVAATRRVTDPRPFFVLRRAIAEAAFKHQDLLTPRVLMCRHARARRQPKQTHSLITMLVQQQ